MDYHKFHKLLDDMVISVKRLLVTLSDEAVVIWQAYQVRNKIRNRDDALDQLIREFGGLAPAPKE